MSITRVIFVVVGLLIAGHGFIMLLQIIKLTRACNKATEGVIVDFKNDWSSSSEASEYTPFFRYIVDGNEYIQTSANHTSYFGKSGLGAKATIFYNPNNPGQCYAKGHNSNTLQAIGGVIFLIIGLPIIAYGLSNLATFN